MVLTYFNVRPGLGLGLSPDSLDYLSAGRNIAHSGQLATFTGTPLTTFPAGLPTTIASIDWAGGNDLQVMLGINILCAGSLVLLTFWTGARLCRSGVWGLVSAALVAASPAVPTTFRMLWSEPMFAVAMMVVVAVGVGALRRHHLRGRDAALLIVAANVASLYRYIGLALLPAIFLGVWWAGAGRTRATRLRDAGLITAGAAAGAAVNVLRNVAVGDGAMGPRYGSELGILSVLRAFATAFAAQFVGNASAPLVVLVLALAVATLLVGCLGAWRVRDAAFAWVVIVLTSYGCALVLAQLTTRLDPIGNRMLVPLVAPAALVLGYGWSTAWRWHARSRTPGDPNEFHTPEGASALRALVGLMVVFAVVGAAVQTALHVRPLGGGSAQSGPATDTPLTAAVRSLPSGTGLASNSAAQLWRRTGRVPIEQLPRDGYYWPPAKIADDQRRLERRIDSGEITYVAVFDGARSQTEAPTPLPQSRQAALDWLRAAGFDVTSEGEFDDGALYRVSRFP